MEIKQKHGKHALRKAVTAAVLAGTAFSSLGGFAGAVTTVKADEYSSILNPYSEDYEKLSSLVAEIAVERSFNNDSADKIRKLLQELSTETLNSLLYGMDHYHSEYGNASIDHFDKYLKPFDSEGEYYRSNGFGLPSLLVEEISRRVNENEKRGRLLSEKEEENRKLLDQFNNTLEAMKKAAAEAEDKKSEISKKEKELNELKAEISENTEELADAYENLEKAEESVKEKEALVKELEAKVEESNKEKEELAENLKTAEEMTDELQKKALESEKTNKDLSEKLKEAQEALEAEKAKLAEAKEANDKLTEERDAAKKKAEKVPELEEQVEKLVEEITAAKKEAEELQAKAEGLEKDFEAVKAEKEALEAEIAKLKEDHQKEVDALNALLADKETMLKNLQDQLDKAKEEAMKNEQMSQEEKAKLQAELDKAKQELAEKIKDMPNKVAPQAEGKANAGQAAPNQNQNNQAQANQAKNANNLPSTGDKPVNPLLVASGLSLMIGAGAFVYAGKRKKG